MVFSAVGTDNKRYTGEWDPDLADIAEDEEWRRLVALADDKRGEKNAKQKEITALKKAKKEVDPQMLVDLKALDKKVKEAEAATEPQLQKVLKMFDNQLTCYYYIIKSDIFGSRSSLIKLLLKESAHALFLLMLSV